MNFFGKAENAASDIHITFEDPSGLPEPLAKMFLRGRDGVPCRRWSWRNQLLVAVHGFTDARGFRQWQAVGRWVRNGEKAMYIITPVTGRWTDASSGEIKEVLIGFKGVPVFGYEQTDGRLLPACDPEVDRWIESLPLVGVAKAWGLSVEAFGGEGATHLGSYRRWNGIAVGVKNLATWAHELVHAADDRNGNLKESRQRWRSETVAEPGGAVLLRLLGHDEEADLGGCRRYIERYAAQAGLEVVEACGKVLDRTCAAVALILGAAGRLGRRNGPDTAA